MQSTENEKKANQCITAHQELTVLRKFYEPLWRDIIDLVAVSRYNLDDFDQQGKKTGLKVYSSAATLAAREWADGMYGHMVNQAIEWFRLRIKPTWLMQMLIVREWLELLEEHLYDVFDRSNYYEQLPDMFLDAGTIGTSTMQNEEVMGDDRINYTTIHPGEVWISENRYGLVDTLFRKYKMSLRQLVQSFGVKADEVDEGLPDDLKQKWELMERQPETMSGKETLYDVIHGVYPRDNVQMYYESGRPIPRLGKRNKPFASMYVLLNSKHLLRESGYDQFPYTVWRTRKSTKELYGRSPAGDAIIEIFTGNQMSRTMNLAAQGAVEPAWVIPSILKGKFHDYPRGKNFVEDTQTQTPKPLHDTKNYPVGMDREERQEQIIRKHFQTDFFTMLTRAAFEGRQLTVPQVMEMQGEKAVMLTTVIGRLISDVLTPNIDRAFAIEGEAGRLPPPPRILVQKFAGAPIDIEYIGPLAQAQKRLFKSQPVMSTLVSLQPLFELFPETRDLINPDEAARHIMDASGAPARMVREQDAVKGIRKIRAQQQDAMTKLSIMKEAARQVPNLQKKTEPGSPLEALTGGGEAAGNA